MRTIFLFGLLICIAGCYSIKTAEKQLIKAKVHYPELVASTYSMWFPIKTDTVVKIETRKGNDIVKYDTVRVDCDSALKEKVSIVKVPFEVSKYRVDTIYNTTTSTLESSAKLNEAKEIIRRITNERDEALTKAASLRTSRNIFLIGMIIAITALLVTIYLKSIIRI